MLEIQMPSKRSIVAIALVIAAAGVLGAISWITVGREWSDSDACLDSGGRWHYDEHRCEHDSES